MPAGGAAGDRDSVRGDAMFLRRSSQIANSRFDVVNLCWKLGDRRKAVIDAGHCKAALSQWQDRRIILGAAAPRAAMDPDHQWWRLGTRWNVEIEFECSFSDAGIFDIPQRLYFVRGRQHRIENRQRDQNQKRFCCVHFISPGSWTLLRTVG